MNKLKSIGFILDGNRRYSKKKGISYQKAYQKGANKALNIIEHIYKKHKSIDQVFMYTLSCENLKNRSKKEIKELFKLIKDNLENLKKIENKNIEVKIIGRINELKKYPSVYNIIKKTNKKEKTNSRLKVYLCFNYNGRYEILDAINKIIKKKRKKEITETEFRKYLYNKNIIDPQIIVRTSGVSRLSGFMLYYSAYSELLFINKLWPEINTNDVDRIIKNYKNIKRNFGK
jgi:undecaprenyl diphosphate synthase